uniref:Reverse transcriptase Ty1/copia-type domain-containing protein n=1 Tax=Tanacetum cinerariifolium TaxID=118510 RepID=A0A6L2L304_TANCI|nr:hypothetical protein [Tanacetum cinerariifolium]
MLLNLDQLDKHLSKEEFQELESFSTFRVLLQQFQTFLYSGFSFDNDEGLMIRKYFIVYTKTSVLLFHATLIQHMESLRESILKRAKHKRENDRRVNDGTMKSKEGKFASSKALDVRMIVTKCSGTKSDKNVFNANHDACITKFLKEVNSHVKVQSPKTRNSNKLVKLKIHTQKPGRWVPTEKTFTSSTTKVDNETLNGSNKDTTNPYECEQTLIVSADTLNLSAGTSFNPKEETLRVWLQKKLMSKNQVHQGIHKQEQSLNTAQEPALHEMTPTTISSRFVPNSIPSTPIVPPLRNYWDLLFQPLFDELLNPPPSVDELVPKVIAPITKVVSLKPAKSTGLPSSTTVDPDAPSASNSQTSPETQSLVISNDVKEENHNLDVAHINNDPFFGISILENISEASSSSDVIPTVVHIVAPKSEHVNKWTKDHPLDNIIDKLERPISIRLQLHEQALFCYYDAFLSLVKPKTYKDALTQACWIEAMQEELNEFECLEVWEFVPRPDKVMVITLKWTYKVEQAPRTWYDLLSKFLLSQEFSKRTMDPTLFIRRHEKDFLQFKMSMMGKISLFLGLQILQSPRGIFLNQSKYALESLKKYGMESSDPVDTPMVEKSKLDEDPQGKTIDPTHYHGMVGTLMCLTVSRPDLTFIVCMCVRYQAKPTEKHLHAVKRIFKYLRGIVNRGLCAIALCCNNVQYSSKHIDIIFHFIKEQVENGVVKLYFVNTEYQLANIFTKALSRERIEFLINKLGMRSFTPETLKQLADEAEE